VKIVISIDVEAHRTLREIDRDEDSLGKILDALARYGVTGTFFIDVCEIETWGLKYVQAVCDRIRRGGHELALHIHAHHLTKDKNRWQLSEYSEDEQRAIIRHAVEQFRQLAGTSPRIFRAGGFGLNDATLKILAEEGVWYDSSFVPGWRGCGISVPHSEWRAFFDIGRIREIPPTAVVGLNVFGRQLRIQALDFNWMPLFYIKRVLTCLRRSKSEVVVLLMHSSSMMRRVSATEVEYKESNFKKLYEMLEYLQSFGDFRTIGACSALWQENSRSKGQMWVEPNVFLQYVLLLYQSYIGKGISRKFFVFWWSHVAMALAIVAAPILLGVF
jgi:peptidoglycan/xylan/chitin deacetylase (PgdA/CDA1 family)